MRIQNDCVLLYLWIVLSLSLLSCVSICLCCCMCPFRENLSRDKFMKEKMDTEEGGYVALSVLVTFPRVTKLCASMEEADRINLIRELYSGMLLFTYTSPVYIPSHPL